MASTMKSRHAWLLLLTLSLGLLLRLYPLDAESIWYDEAYTIRVAHLGFWDVIADCSKDVHPPAYLLLMRYWVHVFGDSVYSVRFPSVIFGLLSVYMAYRVGGSFFSGETGVLASAIMAVSLIHVRYSQDARMYPLLVLLTLLSMYFFHRTLILGKKGPDAAAYVLSTTLLVYTHNYGLFIPLARTSFSWRCSSFEDRNIPPGSGYG